MSDDICDSVWDVAAEAVNACLSTLIEEGLPLEEVYAGALGAVVSAIAAECSGREAAALCIVAARRIEAFPSVDRTALIAMPTRGRA